MRHGYSLSTFLSLQNCRWTPFSESSAELSSKSPDSASYCEEFKIRTLEVRFACWQPFSEAVAVLKSCVCLTLLPRSSQEHSVGLAAPISASAMEGTLFFFDVFSRQEVLVWRGLGAKLFWEELAPDSITFHIASVDLLVMKTKLVVGLTKSSVSMLLVGCSW